MSEFKLNTPVAFIIFRRPDTTVKVFEAIRQAKPPKLLVVADGPRADRADEAEKCAAARAVIEQVDWDCKVLTNYAETNLGCKKRVSSGLNWVFELVEEAIILEDDCLPHPSFFQFCETLLCDYRTDERVVSISGQNVQFGRKRTDYSYYFSRYNHCWGWASWRRAWQYYDVDMQLWSTVRDGNFLKDILQNPRAVRFWTDVFQYTYDNQGKSWDMQWTFACWIQSGLSILSNVNLVSNIGFDLEGTHTLQESEYANLPVEAVEFPLKHPSFMVRDDLADEFTQNTLYDMSRLLRAKRKLKRFSKRLNKYLP